MGQIAHGTFEPKSLIPAAAAAAADSRQKYKKKETRKSKLGTWDVGIH